MNLQDIAFNESYSNYKDLIDPLDSFYRSSRLYYYMLNICYVLEDYIYGKINYRLRLLRKITNKYAVVTERRTLNSSMQSREVGTYRIFYRIVCR